MTKAYILRPGDTTLADLLGGKGAALAALHESGMVIPAWFALTPDAFAASLMATQRAALDRACQAGDERAMDDVFAGVALAPAVQAELAGALAALCPETWDGTRVAVRSSALEEDGAARSFAGQLESYLDVPLSAVAGRVVAVWRSAYSARALAYRRANGLPGVPRPPAVLVQRMVAAEWAGVAFSADPVSGRRGVAVVSAVAGLGDRLVSGACDGATWRVARDGTVTSPLAPPLAGEERQGRIDGPTAGGRPPDAPTDGPEVEIIQAVAELARTCERRLGRPQDIEWSVAGGQVWLLQARPITTLAGQADPDGAYQLWDNSNIAESYNGVTTPLTFSFARHIYEAVYRQICRVLGAPESVIVAQDNTFRHMLGYIQGRVYYNLLNWYRLLALLPGFTINRRFMEQMMGVKEGLPEEIAAELARATWRDRLNDARRFVLAVGGLAGNYLLLPRRIRRFQERLDEALAQPRPGLDTMRPDELVANYRALEQRLITRWDAPLLNDLFAMIFYGLLRALAVKWCGDAAGTLQNDLVAGAGGMVSAEPAAHVRAMAALAANDTELVATLRAGDRGACERALSVDPALWTAYANYLERFADRCLEELKLESPTLRDDPLPLLRAVGHLAARTETPPPNPSPSEERGSQAQRREAGRRVRAALAKHPLRRVVFGWVLRGARRHVLARENLRFERTRVFGRVRLIFVELGRRLAALDLLEQPRDIFFLEVDEALGFVEGTATCTDLKGLVALRRAEHARYQEAEPPADRFATRGIVNQGNRYQAERAAGAEVGTASGERRSGTGCYPGVVRGPVRVVRDPRHAEVRAGEILVAERTDPGWIMLFPAAAGVLVERGSLLSHSAIVARELGIPTVVAIGGLTGWLGDGDWVELDGGAGTVARIAPPEVFAMGARDGDTPVASGVAGARSAIDLRE